MYLDRLGWLILVFASLWLVLVSRTFQIQVLNQETYKEHAQEYALRQMNLYAERGKIMDREGIIFADNIKDKENKHLEYSRIFLQGKMASQLIGKVGYNGRGAMGLERQFDEDLRGNSGYLLSVQTAGQKIIHGLEKDYEEAIPGKNMILTIDRDMQEIVENSLKEGVETYKATSASAIVVDPFTGEILALASYPTFDPNQKLQTSASRAFRNDLVSLSFEPGSTFKVITAAAALEENAVNPKRKMSGENGHWVLPNGEVIRDTKDHGDMDMTEAMTYSSNIVYAKIADSIGSEHFYRFVRDFGFGTKTSEDLIGEESGFLKEPHTWSGRTLKTMGFGHELSVTPIQMIMAFSAIANGGKLMQPMIIKEWTDENGNTLEKKEPVEIRRVISEKTAAHIREMLYQVVVNGTAKSVMSSKIPNVDFGGKTGTAEKYSQELKRYDRNSQIASFIGFSPARDVRYVCLVLLDDPKTKTVGGLTAGPVFRKIMESIYFHPKLSPMPYNLVQVTDNKKCEIDFVGMSVEEAKKLASNKGCSVAFEGSGSTVISQKISDKKEAKLELKRGHLNYSQMPDLRGLPLKDALEAMSFVRMPVEFSGKGRVQEQFPEPSASISKGQTCKLILKEKV